VTTPARYASNLARIRERGAQLAASQIATEDDARTFIRECVRLAGLDFHPDTPFSEYCAPGPGLVPAFAPEVATALDAHLVLSMALVDVYAVGFDAMKELKLY
jgi:hypothetical protein